MRKRIVLLPVGGVERGRAAQERDRVRRPRATLQRCGSRRVTTGVGWCEGERAPPRARSALPLAEIAADRRQVGQHARTARIELGARHQHVLRFLQPAASV